MVRRLCMGLQELRWRRAVRYRRAGLWLTRSDDVGADDAGRQGGRSGGRAWHGDAPLPPAPERRADLDQFDRFERGVCLGAVRTASLRHVRAPPAPFAAERLGAFAHQVDGGEAGGQVSRDADHDAGLALLCDANDGDDTGTQALLAFVGEAAQVLEIDALDRARQKLHVAHETHTVRVLRSTAAHGELLLRLRQLALKAAALLKHLRETLRHIVERRLEFGRGGLRELPQVARVLARRRPGERLDAAHASRNGAVAERGNHADVAGAPDVRAAAQLHRPAHRVTATLAH